ncbi:MAG TPA: ABC transporter ATP-binding protein [Hyphomonadaceae bacterium]|nr:ABC transporter ATP-binding protein [Hyphomonadaceae bacterium]
MTALLEAENISKSFRTASGPVDALRDFSLNVPKGIVYGLLGPNGAGKSTFLRIVLGLIHADRGQCRLFGESGQAALRRVGALIESPSLYPFLTARQTLLMLGRTSGIDAGPDIGGLLDRVGLTAAADRPVRGFSLGMKQRLGIASALLTRPELVILDEPTNGMDPAGIQEIRVLLRDLVDRDGATVLLSSHLLSEVERVCDRVAILNHGALIVEGVVSDLVGRESRLRIEVAPIQKASEILGARAIRDGEHALLVSATRAEAPGLIKTLVDGGIDVFESRWTLPTLESIFLDRTGGAG